MKTMYNIRSMRRHRCVFGLSMGLCLCFVWSVGVATAQVLPHNHTTVSGGVTVESTTPTSMTIRQTTAGAIINWQSFNIAANHLVEFIQPSANAIALNRVVGLNGVIPTSLIDGTLRANGIVLLLNQNGILFGSGAQVNVGGLVASTLHMTDVDFLSGTYRATRLVTDGLVQTVGDIRNAGTITAGTHGVYLLAPNVENSGVITSPNGSIVLAAGTTAYLANRPDGRGFLVELQAPAGSARNLRDLTADGGSITMAGLVVNQQGLVQANTVQGRQGRIELVAKQPATAQSGDPLASLTLSAGSVTRADGGAIVINGQTVSHHGELYANGGSIELTATAGAQAGSGALLTGAGSMAIADGGSILLAGNTIVHGGTLQANRLNLLSGSIDLRARGTAGALTTASGSRLTANGGNITLEGRTIDQGGVIQADASGNRSGHVTFFGGDGLTFRSTSDITTRGSATGEADGGTIIGMASNVGGVVAVDPAARFDVSPGAGGGLGGEIWLGDRRQSLGLIGSGTVTGAAQARLIPIDLTVSNVSGVGPQRDVSLVALNDLTVTGIYDLASLAPGASSATMRFVAGRDLKFDNATIQNDWFNLGLPPRDLVGMAGNHINLSGSTLVSGGGGNISLTARNGNISLIDPLTGALSSLRVKGGGDLSLDAQRDIVASVRVDPDASGLVDSFQLDSNLQGIAVDGTRTTDANGARTGSGMLSITARDGDFIGGQVFGSSRGPGFVVRNADAKVTVGGTIGRTNLPVDVNGLLPDAIGLANLHLTEDVRGYLDLALTDAHVSLAAAGNVYLRRVRDAGLLFEPLSGGDAAVPYDIGRFGFPGEAIGLTPQFNNGFQHNSLAVTSHRGNVIINGSRISAEAGSVELVDAGTYFPAATDIRAPLGTIQIRAAMNFFNGPRAAIKFFAGKSIEGVATTVLVPPPSNLVFWVYAGFDINPNNWRVVDLRQTVPAELLRWVGVTPPDGASASRPQSLPAGFLTAVPSSIPLILLSQQRPEALIGLDPRQGNNLGLLSRPGTPDPISAPGRIEFATGTGDIRNLALNLLDPTYLKETVVKAGGNIENVSLRATASQLGTEARTITERVPLVRDAQTGLLRLVRQDELIAAGDVVVTNVTVTLNVPKPAVTLEARGTIDLSKAVRQEGIFQVSGLFVTGDGVVHVRAGRNLTLGDGSGIIMRAGQTPSGTRRGGLLDIAVGQDLSLTQSRIVTDGGAGISIHGTDLSYIPGYDNSALHPLEVPESVRGTVNEAYLGGRVDVGATVRRIEGEDSTGIQVRGGGSVGDRAVATVHQNGTVSVNLVRDSTAIKIQSEGDVNVNASRVATFSGGDIRIVSRSGSINAGSGGKNEQQQFPLDIPLLDANGNPVLNADGTPRTERQNFLVPGSGIFTYHPRDPQVLNFPKFDTPAITAVKTEIVKQRFLGRDTTRLEQQADALIAARTPEFDLIFEDFITRNPAKNGQPLELGDVYLKAGQDILVPPAGIRGKRVELDAGRALDFQGGEVQGKVRFKAQRLTGDVKVSGTFAGSSSGGGSVSIANSGGGGSVGGLSGVTGTVAATSSSTSASVSSAQKATESVQEAAADLATQQANAQAQQVAKKSDGQGDSKKKPTTIRTSRGVVIQVDVKPQTQPGG